MNRLKKICLLVIITTFTATSSFADTVNAPEKKRGIMESVVSWYMDNMNYGTVTLLMAVESSFLPMPSEAVVPPAVYKASEKDSDMTVVGVILFATLGAMIGSTFNYFIALLLGRPIIYRLAESKIGKLCLLSEEKVKKAEAYFVKHGKASTFIGRLVPVVRHLISIPAGLSRMNYGVFILYTTIGAGLWNIILAALGYLAHGNADIINAYSHELSIALLGLGVIFVLYLVYNGFLKKKAKNKEQ